LLVAGAFAVAEGEEFVPPPFDDPAVVEQPARATMASAEPAMASRSFLFTIDLLSLSLSARMNRTRGYAR
jgi:hypothetical protein